jgi:hypothetical protein
VRGFLCSYCSQPFCSSNASIKKYVSDVSGTESEEEDDGVPVMNRDIQDPALYKTYVDLPHLCYIHPFDLICLVLYYKLVNSVMFILSLDGETLNCRLERRSPRYANFFLMNPRGVSVSNRAVMDFAVNHLA